MIISDYDNLADDDLSDDCPGVATEQQLLKPFTSQTTHESNEVLVL